MHYTLLAALDILRFSTVSDDPDAAPRFQAHHVDPSPHHYGYHADDWFRALCAMIFFLERRRKPIDVSKGNFNTGRLFLYKVTATDQNRMAIESLATVDEESAQQEHITYLHMMRTQAPTLPPGIDDNRFTWVLRRADAHLDYMASLVQPSSLSAARIASLTAKKAKASGLNKRYSEMLPLSVMSADMILTMLRARFSKGIYHSCVRSILIPCCVELKAAPRMLIGNPF